MELIKIKQTENGQQTVLATDLYNFLEPKTQFKDWIERMLKYGFIENVDFYSILSNKNVCPSKLTSKEFRSNLSGIKRGRKPKEYILTLDCAKSIAMVQRSEKGKQIRKYFLFCEQVAKGKETYQIQQLNIELSIYKRLEQIRLTRLDLNNEVSTLRHELLLIQIKNQPNQLTLNFNT